MTFSVLYMGDIVGEPGREAVAELLPGLKKQYDPDLILANAENATHGQGLNPQHYQYLKKLGIDGLSSGDHIWRYDEIIAELDKPDVMVTRPANYPGSPGKGYLDFVVKGKRVRMINLIGRVFMQANLDSPFFTFDRLVTEPPAPDAVIVDFHAEATSEKRCLAEYIDGRAQLVVGTHTHVPTADAQILASGTGFISDLGMTGPRDSSLGADKREVIKNFLTGMPWRYTVGAGQCELGAVFCTIDFESKRATRIEPIRQFTASV
ncbi:YmdB family metallophosphoesterase [Patescibacteria group bacterium]|nr:YmdB family metallophosphoesterase [Patescibacteria group bacterium]